MQSADRVAILVRVPPEIAQKIKAIAARERRTQQYVCEFALAAIETTENPPLSPCSPPPDGFPPSPMCIYNTPPSLTSPSHPPLTPAPAPARASRGDDPDFEAFWMLYPRRTAKEAARTAFRRAAGRVGAETILNGLRRAVWPAESQFIPHPATWLNQGRWDDEPNRPDSPKQAVTPSKRVWIFEGTER